MIAFKPSFQARTLSLQARSAWRIVAGRGRLRAWTWATPHAGHVRACRLLKARTATRSRHPGDDARGEYGVVNQGRRPIQKARDRFPGAGSILAMMKTCQ